MSAIPAPSIGPCFDCPIPPALAYIPTPAELDRFARQVAPPFTTIKPEVKP